MSHMLTGRTHLLKKMAQKPQIKNGNHLLLKYQKQIQKLESNQIKIITSYLKKHSRHYLQSLAVFIIILSKKNIH